MKQQTRAVKSDEMRGRHGSSAKIHSSPVAEVISHKCLTCAHTLPRHWACQSWSHASRWGCPDLSQPLRSPRWLGSDRIWIAWNFSHWITSRGEITSNLRASSRSRWVLSPWMEVTGKPSLWRNSSKESAPRFVSTNTRVLEAWPKIKMKIGRTKVELVTRRARVGLVAAKPSLSGHSWIPSVKFGMCYKQFCTTLNEYKNTGSSPDEFLEISY